jgi:hypothetical protein
MRLFGALSPEAGFGLSVLARSRIHEIESVSSADVSSSRNSEGIQSENLLSLSKPSSCFKTKPTHHVSISLRLPATTSGR